MMRGRSFRLSYTKSKEEASGLQRHSYKWLRWRDVRINAHGIQQRSSQVTGQSSAASDSAHIPSDFAFTHESAKVLNNAHAQERWRDGGTVRDVHVSPDWMRPNLSLATFEISSMLASAHGLPAQR